MLNALEEVVRRTYAEIVEKQPDFCRCRQCTDDVLAHAMNHARPRYIGSTDVGAAVTRVALGTDQARAELAVLVLDAMKVVGRKPRHGTQSTPGYNETVAGSA